MVKCSNCRFDAPIWEWQMIEAEGVTKIPEEQMKEIEKMKESKEPHNPKERLGLEIAFLMFKAINKAGLMPYHETKYVCPKCHTPLTIQEKRVPIEK